MQVLYDFCVSRGEFREAAAAQLALARRLRDEDPKAVQAVHAALSASLPISRNIDNVLCFRVSLFTPFRAMLPSFCIHFCNPVQFRQATVLQACTNE